MTLNTSHSKKVKYIISALLFSGALNITSLIFFSYWMMRERPPTPYFELKPALGEQETPLADQRCCSEAISQLQQLSFSQLLSRLTRTQVIENGYTERDLALSTLVALHHFDMNRALTEEPKQKRLLKWKHPLTGEWVMLTVYPGLTDKQYETLIAFANTEKWPLTPAGQYHVLHMQREEQNIDPSLADAFMMTQEFMTFEILFSRTDSKIRKQQLLEMLLEGEWDYIKQFSEQQKQLNDLSVSRRQKVLLDLIKLKSETAAYLLLDTDFDFALRKLDDIQVIGILQLLGNKTKESEAFALQLLTSPRNSSVWQQASLRLYEYAGEPIPKDWNYQTSLARFAPAKLEKKEIQTVQAQQPASTPSKLPQKTPVASSKPTPAKKIEPPKPVVKAKPVEIAQAKPIKPVVPQVRLYIVQEGDSLWKISRRFGVDMEVLKKKNKLKSNAIKPGSVLKIP